MEDKGSLGLQLSLPPATELVWSSNRLSFAALVRWQAAASYSHFKFCGLHVLGRSRIRRAPPRDVSPRNRALLMPLRG